MQGRLEQDMLDNAFVERSRHMMSCLKRGTHTSASMASQWMSAAEGAATFLQARTLSTISIPVDSKLQYPLPSSSCCICMVVRHQRTWATVATPSPPPPGNFSHWGDKGGGGGVEHNCAKLSPALSLYAVRYFASLCAPTSQAPTPG